MWHVIHLVVRPLEVVIGVFCLVTAILLYPNQEGKIQSKLEDFWIRLDDYRQLAVSQNSMFLQDVAKLETRLLNRIFGDRLLSSQSIIVSICFSILPVAVASYLDDSVGRDDLWIPLILSCVVVALTYILKLSKIIRLATIFISLAYIAVYFVMNFRVPADNLDEIYPFLLVTALGGLPCDIVFIAATRKLIRWAGAMTNSFRVAGVISLSLLLALAMVSFLFVPNGWADSDANWNTTQFLFSALATVSFSNILDASLALLFVFLCMILLVHRALWPLLVRTVFRVQEVGTKGRRAILTTIGLALLSTSVFGGKIPDLFKEVIKSLGG